MGGASEHVWGEEMCLRVWSGSLGNKRHFEDKGIHGRIILI
jgi:hypothetical protein